MRVRVQKENEKHNCHCVVKQKNKIPIENNGEHLPVFSFDRRTIFVTVPMKTASVTHQTSLASRVLLENCYKHPIILCASSGFDSISIPQLGVDLYWDVVQSASAARKAILDAFEEVPEDYEVVFCVPNEDYEIWDETMRF